MKSPRINTINKSRRIRPKKKSLRRKSKRSKPRKKSRVVKKSRQLVVHNRKMSRRKPINRKSKKVRTRPKKIKNKRSVRRKTASMDTDEKQEKSLPNPPPNRSGRNRLPHAITRSSMPPPRQSPTRGSFGGGFPPAARASSLSQFQQPGNLSLSALPRRAAEIPGNMGFARWTELQPNQNASNMPPNAGLSAQPNSSNLQGLEPVNEFEMLTDDVSENQDFERQANVVAKNFGVDKVPTVIGDLYDSSLSRGESAVAKDLYNRMLSDFTQYVDEDEKQMDLEGTSTTGSKQIKKDCTSHSFTLTGQDGSKHTFTTYIDFAKGQDILKVILRSYNRTADQGPSQAAKDFEYYFNKTLNSGQVNFPSVIYSIIDSVNPVGIKDPKICCNPNWTEGFSGILTELETNGNLSKLITDYVRYDGTNINMFNDILTVGKATVQSLPEYKLRVAISYTNYLSNVLNSLKSMSQYIYSLEDCSQENEYEGLSLKERYDNLIQNIDKFYSKVNSSRSKIVELLTVLVNLKFAKYGPRIYKTRHGTGNGVVANWIIPDEREPTPIKINNFYKKLNGVGSDFPNLKIPTGDHPTGYTVKHYIKTLDTLIDSTTTFAKLKINAALLLERARRHENPLPNAITTQITQTRGPLNLQTTINKSGIPIFALDSMHDLSRISELKVDNVKVKKECLKNLKKLMDDNKYGGLSYSHPEQLSGFYGLMLKKELDNSANKDSLLIITDSNKVSQFELMTPDEYFSNDLPYNATASPASIGSLVGNATTITAQDTNGKIGGKDSNIQCATNNTLCSIDAGGSSKNFDSEEQGWFRLNRTLAQPVDFEISLNYLLVRGIISGPGGIINISFLFKRSNGHHVEYASANIDNEKNTGIDNKTGAIISAIIDKIVTSCPLRQLSVASRSNAKARSVGGITKGWETIEQFREFFKKGKLAQPTEENKIRISANCTLTIETSVFDGSQKNYNRLYLENKHIAVGPLLLKFYGDQTFRITASYASKLNQIYQAKYKSSLNNIFTRNPANALTANIASSDYIHFISTLCHDVTFTQNNLQILSGQVTDEDVGQAVNIVFNELPLLLGENIPGAQSREDSMAKPNITIISAQDEIQKKVLSAFCERSDPTNQRPHVSEFMSCLANSIIRVVKNNPKLQKYAIDAYKALQKVKNDATLSRTRRYIENRKKGEKPFNFTSYNKDISEQNNEILHELNNRWFEIRIANLEQLYNIKIDKIDDKYIDLYTSGSQYKSVKKLWEARTFLPLKFKVKFLYTSFGFADKLNSDNLLTQIIVDDEYTHNILRNILTHGITSDSIPETITGNSTLSATPTVEMGGAEEPRNSTLSATSTVEMGGAEEPRNSGSQAIDLTEEGIFDVPTEEVNFDDPFFRGIFDDRVEEGTFNFPTEDEKVSIDPVNFDVDYDENQDMRSSGPFKLKGLILANHLAYSVLRNFRVFGIDVSESSEAPVCETFEYKKGYYYIDENGYKDGPHTLEELCKEGEFDEKGVGSTKKRRFLQP